MISSLSPPVSHKIIRNTVFNSLGRLWTMAVAFLLTPYMVSMLGPQRFGVWSLILGVTSYCNLFDLGISTSLVKYTSEYYAKKDYKAINSTISTGFLVYLFLAIIVVGLVSISANSILHFFKIPLEIYNEAAFVLLAAVVIHALSNTLGMFQAVITGLQRMDVTSIITIAASMPGIIGTLVFLQLGYGLRGLIISRALVVALTAILLAIYSFNLLPSLRINPGLSNISSLRKLLGYGIKIQITNLGALTNLHMNKILIGYFFKLNQVAFYELGFKIAHTATSLPMLLISAITPAASEVEAKRDIELLQQLYRRGSKYLTLAVAPMAIFTVLNAPLIMSVWMGTGHTKSVLVTRLLTISFSVSLLTGVGTTMARGVGKPGYETSYGLVTIVLNVLLGIGLIMRVGFSGVLIATLLASVTGSAYFMRLFHRHLKISLAQFMRETYPKPIIACLLASLCVFASHRAVSFIFAQPTRLVNLAILGLEACIFVAVYLITIFRSGYLDSYDKEILKSAKVALCPFRIASHQPRMS